MQRHRVCIVTVAMADFPTPFTIPLNAAQCRILRAAAESALDPLRPALHGDGGDAHVVEVTVDGIALIEFVGHCIGCPASAVTMRLGIERSLLAAVPALRGVAEAPRGRPVGTAGRYEGGSAGAASDDAASGSGGSAASRRSGAVKSPFET